VPWLLGRPYDQLDPEYRKAFEVALHAGTAAGLLLGLRREVGDAARHLDARRLALVALSFAPPAVAGLTLERPIEQHTGTPPTIAVGLLAGSALMLAADRAPEERVSEEATWLDGLVLGLAQACALVPGVSRNGATLSAARLRRFRRPDASRLSRHVALPVIVGATWLKGARLARRGVPRELHAPFAAGTAASFLSTIASAWIVGRVDRGHRLAPYAAYRSALALAVLARAVRSAR
jgi:undecaprenyl-diphosphatase